jgi:hypothetical protein
VTTFAIIYTRQDMTAIAAEVTNPGLSNQERQTANRYWSGGINNWANAPYAGDARACVQVTQETAPVASPGSVVTQIGSNPNMWMICDPDIRAVVCSGTQVSKQGLVDFLRAIGNKYPGAQYMTAIADDVALTAVEPWLGQ